MFRGRILQVVFLFSTSLEEKIGPSFGFEKYLL